MNTVYNKVKDIIEEVVIRKRMITSDIPWKKCCSNEQLVELRAIIKLNFNCNLPSINKNDSIVKVLEDIVFHIEKEQNKTKLIPEIIREHFKLLYNNLETDNVENFDNYVLTSRHFLENGKIPSNCITKLLYGKIEITEGIAEYLETLFIKPKHFWLQLEKNNKGDCNV